MATMGLQETLGPLAQQVHRDVVGGFALPARAVHKV